MTAPDRDRPRRARRKRLDEEPQQPATPAQRKRPPRMRAGRTDLDRLAETMGNTELQRLLAQELRPDVIDTDRPAPLVPQESETSGWAASFAMLVSRREGRQLSARDVATTSGLNVTDSYTWSEIARAMATWGLRSSPPAVWTPQPWGDLLARLGPLCIIQPGDPSCAVVLTAMHGDGSAEGTHVTLLNPGPDGEGAVEQVRFQEFHERYGVVAGANIEVLHA